MVSAALLRVCGGIDADLATDGRIIIIFAEITSRVAPLLDKSHFTRWYPTCFYINLNCSAPGDTRAGASFTFLEDVLLIDLVDCIHKSNQYKGISSNEYCERETIIRNDTAAQTGGYEAKKWIWHRRRWLYLWSLSIIAKILTKPQFPELIESIRKCCHSHEYRNSIWRAQYLVLQPD